MNYKQIPTSLPHFRRKEHKLFHKVPTYLINGRLTNKRKIDPAKKACF